LEQEGGKLSTSSLFLALLLISISVLISRYGKLGLEKDLMVGTVRTFIQLLAVGYLLQYIFDLNRLPYIMLMVLMMVLVAARNSAKRGKGIPKIFGLVFLSICFSTVITLSSLLVLRIIDFSPRFIIPISGMIVGNSMSACSLSLNRLKGEMKSRRHEIEAALALGANSWQASYHGVRETIKAGMIPSIDSMKTVGIVSLPGMMTGQIIAGASPLAAVKYQIVVMYMIAAAVSLTTMAISFLTYRQFFTPNLQLKEELLGKV
jgi:putative ABC transport system permease protein